VIPLIGSAQTGNEFKIIANEEDPPTTQSFCPYTEIFPDVAIDPKFTVILLVVLVPFAPVGKVHVYEVALVIAGTV